MKKDKINNIRKIIIYCLIISAIVVGVIFIKIGFHIEKSQKSIYQYIVEKQDNYEVLLKPNTFYESKTFLLDFAMHLMPLKHLLLIFNIT